MIGRRKDMMTIIENTGKVNSVATSATCAMSEKYTKPMIATTGRSIVKVTLPLTLICGFILFESLRALEYLCFFREP
jgi:hypothetical protein